MSISRFIKLKNLSYVIVTMTFGICVYLGVNLFKNIRVDVINSKGGATGNTIRNHYGGNNSFDSFGLWNYCNI